MKIIYSLLILATLSSCKFSESSDGKRIIAIGTKLAEDEAVTLINSQINK